LQFIALQQVGAGFVNGYTQHMKFRLELVGSKRIEDRLG